MKDKQVNKQKIIQANQGKKLIFSKVRQTFGGRIRQMITRNAPISKKSLLFVQMIRSCPMFKGYGQTQNTTAVFMGSQHDPVADNVGGVVWSLQFKLADILEMRYTSQDKDQTGHPSPQGGIWLRAPSIFVGYYKLKDKTDQAIPKNRWIKTGDVVVRLSEGGRLRIIDRKKNTFKFQQGQYIDPSKFQDIYSRCRQFSKFFYMGNQLIIIVLQQQNQQSIFYKQLKSIKQKDLTRNYVKVYQ